MSKTIVNGNISDKFTDFRRSTIIYQNKSIKNYRIEKLPYFYCLIINLNNFSLKFTEVLFTDL